MSRPDHRWGDSTEGNRTDTRGRFGNDGSHGSAGQESCDDGGGEVTEVF